MWNTILQIFEINQGIKRLYVIFPKDPFHASVPDISFREIMNSDMVRL